MKKFIHDKDQKLKDKYIERIATKVSSKIHKRGEGSRIDKVRSIGMVYAERYDMFAHQQSLIEYHRSLQMKEKTMEDVITTIKSSGDDKQDLINFNVTLKK